MAMPPAARRVWALLPLLALGACTGDQIPETKDAIPVIDDEDADGDGFKSFIDGGQDCDDEDPSIHPGAVEKCDGIDQDCDREIDNGVQSIYFLDADGDGYGDDATQGVACEPPADSVPDGGDCDDNDPTRSPGLPELCNGIDDDCNASTDEVALIGNVSYPTVAAALDAAQPNARIELCDGIHSLSGYQLNRTVTLASASGDPSQAILEGNGDRSLIIVMGGELTLQNLTLMHGGGSGTAAVYNGAAMGGAIHAINAPLRVENCVFEENIADIGGAIAATELTVIDSVFRSNTATNINNWGWGGAIYIAPAGVAEVVGSTFELNQAAYGGSMLTSGTVTITSSSMTQNTVVASAGGVYALRGRVDLFGTTIASNNTTFAGGVMLDGATGYADESTVIANNTATNLGGGLLLYGTADVIWEGGLIQGNAADFGGGIFIDRVNPATNGYIGSVQVTNVIVENNLSLLNSASSGGGIFAAGSPIDITDSVVVGNRASLGGGVAVNATVVGDPMVLTRVEINGNQATQGAGIDILEAQVSLFECNLSGNIAAQMGGGVHLGNNTILEATSTIFGSPPDDNLPEDVFIASGTNVVSYDYDGSTDIKCDSSGPACQ